MRDKYRVNETNGACDEGAPILDMMQSHSPCAPSQVQDTAQPAADWPSLISQKCDRSSTIGVTCEHRDAGVALGATTGLMRDGNDAEIALEAAAGVLQEHGDDEERRREELIAPIVYQEKEMVMTAEKVRKLKIAADSGAVDHIANPSNLPGNAMLIKTQAHRDFVNASGGGIKNHGQANVGLKTASGRMVANTFQVADVCRPLHSVGKICDGGFNMVFTKNQAVVIPEGMLDDFLKNCQQLVTYERENGLYIAEFEVSAVPAEDMSSFTRHGAGR